MKLNFNKVITHDTTFHADDVIAVALLYVAGYHSFELYRTRNPEALAYALLDRETLVLDTGMAYAPSILNFDHHQDSQLKSAAGLLYMEIKDEVCPVEAQPYFEMFIDSIDAIDTNRNNIYAQWNLLPSGFRHTSAILGGFNRDVTNAEEQDAQFKEAVNFAAVIIRNEVYNAQKKAASEAAYSNRTILENNVAVFEEFSTVWKEKYEHVFVVMPHAMGWQLQSVDTTIAVVPESVSQLPGFIFRHISGFMAVVKDRAELVHFASTLPQMYLD